MSAPTHETQARLTTQLCYQKHQQPSYGGGRLLRMYQSTRRTLLLSPSYFSVFFLFSPSFFLPGRRPRDFPSASKTAFAALEIRTSVHGHDFDDIGTDFRLGCLKDIGITRRKAWPPLRDGLAVMVVSGLIASIFMGRDTDIASGIAVSQEEILSFSAGQGGRVSGSKSRTQQAGSRGQTRRSRQKPP